MLLNRGFSIMYFKQIKIRQHIYLCKNILTPQTCCNIPLNRKISNKPYFIDSAPVKFAQDALITIHDFTSLPWWSSIIISVVGLRMVTTFPLALYQSYVLARFENLKPEIDKIVEEIKKEMPLAVAKFKLNEKEAKNLFRRSVKSQTTKLIIRDNCHPFKGAVSLYIQLPLWVCISLALRNLSLLYAPESVNVQKAYTQLLTEGILWFPDLTIIDTSLALPVILGLINLTTIEIHALQNLRTPPTRLKRWTKNFMRGVSILLVPIAATMPSCVCLYWITSSSFGLAQNLIIQQPRIKRYFGIPITAMEDSKPMKHLNKEIRKKISKLFRKENA